MKYNIGQSLKHKHTGEIYMIYAFYLDSPEHVRIFILGSPGKGIEDKKMTESELDNEFDIYDGEHPTFERRKLRLDSTEKIADSEKNCEMNMTDNLPSSASDFEKLTHKNEELTSICLWAIRRLEHSQHKEFAYDRLEKLTATTFERV